jgi:CDP-glucose 4,6-dehydratase
MDERVTTVFGDVCDVQLLQRVLAEYEVKLCLHLAAQALVGAADRSPLSTWSTNMMGTVTLLEACRQAGTNHVVVASSDKAYGESPSLPYREDAPLLGISPYEASKAGTELVARSFAATYGLTVGIARCANIYGGGDLNFSRLVPDTIRALLAGLNPILRSDGSPRRDYLYATDAADAYLRLGGHCLTTQAPGTVDAFNFGWGVPISAIELVEMLMEIAGRPDLKPTFADRSGSGREIQAQYLDSAKARAQLSWIPSVGLRDGLAITMEWYRSYLETQKKGVKPGCQPSVDPSPS